MLHAQTITVSALNETSDGHLLLHFEGYYDPCCFDDSPTFQHYFHQWFRADGRFSRNLRGDGEAYSLTPTDADGSAASLADDTPPLRVLFPASTDTGSAPRTGTLPLATEAAERLGRLAAATSGDPSAASDLWPRMVYFSGVTVTTLGYGDITPVSSLARTAVTIEAVAGVILIGFFLNSVGQPRRRKRETGDQGDN